MSMSFFEVINFSEKIRNSWLFHDRFHDFNIDYEGKLWFSS